MNVFDIIGPVMVGPSSSHTAGAARIGLVAEHMLGEKVVDATIAFHGSFATTGVGHGTDRALVAGLMGMACDDARLPDAFVIAKKRGLHYHFTTIDLGEDTHPNSVKLELVGESGRTLKVVAASIGGGRIEIHETDGLKTVFSGDYPTLIVENDDHPGVVAKVLYILAEKNINIATVQLDRDSRGGHAVTVIECDQEIDDMIVKRLGFVEGVLKVTSFSMEDK